MVEEKISNPQPAQQTQGQGQGAVQVLFDQVSKLPSDTLSEINRALEEIQANLDPIRDRALDQKSYWTGYAKCSEDFIKMINSRSIYMKNKSDEKKQTEVLEEHADTIAILKEKAESKSNGVKKKRTSKKATQQVEDAT